MTATKSRRQPKPKPKAKPKAASPDRTNRHWAEAISLSFALHNCLSELDACPPQLEYFARGDVSGLTYMAWQIHCALDSPADREVQALSDQFDARLHQALRQARQAATA